MTLSAFLYAEAGSGKSEILGTGPGPIIVADTEGRAHLMKHGGRDVRAWDPGTGEYPTDLTENSVSVVNIQSLADMDNFMSAISSPLAPWRTVGVDSFTVLVRIGERELVKGGAKDQRQEYKALFTRMEQTIVIPLKNIVARPETKAEVLVVTAWQNTEAKKPFMTGATNQTIDQLFDLTAQIQMTFSEGVIGQIAHIMPTQGIRAKAPGVFYMKYGETIVNPNLNSLNQEMEQ